MIGFRSGARKTRVHHDHLGTVLFCMQHVQHRYRMCFSRIRADIQRSFGILHVVVAVRHRTITPGIGNAGDRSRVADARLVIGIIRAEEGNELAQQRRLLVIVLGRANEKYRVRATDFFDVQHLG